MIHKEFHEDVLNQPILFSSHRESVMQIPEQVRSLVNGKDAVLTGIATSLSSWKSPNALHAKQSTNIPVLLNTGDLLDCFYPQSEDSRPLIVMSRSGDSAEIARLMDTVSSERILVGITEGIDSALAKRSNLLLSYAANEKAFPNTCSFTLSQLYALACEIGLGYEPTMPLDELIDVLIEKSKIFCAEDKELKKIGACVAEAATVLIDGQGLLTGLAEQYALDFSETRKTTIAVVGGIMRHGIVELTEKKDVVTILLIPEGPIAERKLKLAHELQKAGKTVIVVTDIADPQLPEDLTIQVPAVPEELKSIFFTFGMQKIYGSYIEKAVAGVLKPELVGKVTRME